MIRRHSVRGRAGGLIQPGTVVLSEVIDAGNVMLIVEIIVNRRNCPRDQAGDFVLDEKHVERPDSGGGIDREGINSVLRVLHGAGKFNERLTYVEISHYCL